MRPASSLVADRRYRIAMVAACPFPVPQGSQVLVHQLSLALAARGHRVFVVTYPFGETGEEPPAPYRVLRTWPLPGYRRLAPGPTPAKLLLDCLLAARLARVVRDRRIDVIHAHHFEGAAAGYCARAWTGRPVVYHGHSGLEDELPTYFRGGLARLLARGCGARMDRFVPRRADALIAVSEEMREYLLRSGAPPARTFHLPPGIDCPPSPPQSREAIETRYGLPPGPKVLYSGNLAPYQNLPALLGAFSRVAREVPGAHLILASHDPRIADPRSWRGWAGRDLDPRRDPVSLVRYASFERERTLLAAADVTVSLSSIRYGFPIKLLNYMAAGKAVLASRVSAKGLVHLDHAWLTGTDEEEIASGLVRLLGDEGLRARLGQRAARSVKEGHGWGSIAPRIEEIYREVTAGRSAPDRGATP